MLSRVIYRTTFRWWLAFPTIIIVFIGVSMGLVAGYWGGATDNLLMRLTDIVYTFPDLLFFIIVMTAFHATALGQFLNGLFLLFVALALVNWVGVAPGAWTGAHAQGTRFRTGVAGGGGIPFPHQSCATFFRIRSASSSWRWLFSSPAR